MLKLMIRAFQVGVFIVIILLAGQIPVDKDAKGHIKRVYHYVDEFTSKDFIQIPLRWAGSKFDFAEGHGFHKAVMKKGREELDQDVNEGREELSGLLKNEENHLSVENEQSRPDRNNDSDQSETDTE